VKTLVTGNKGGKSIYSLAVAGDYLLAGTYENSILVWNLKSYEIVKTLNEHQGCVLSLTVQGQFFFSGSYDTTIKVTNYLVMCTYLLLLIGL
jgi:WD40 repeat protein